MSLAKANLFEQALIEPLNKEANKLFIVSGYATAMMAMRHIEYAKKIKKKFSIQACSNKFAFARLILFDIPQWAP